MPFGMFALNSSRIEKTCRAWNRDLLTGYAVLESGLERFVRWDKPDFAGKRAMEERRRGITADSLRWRWMWARRRCLHVAARAWR